MNSIKLGTKIGGGFGFILLLLLIIATFSWKGLNLAASGIIEYDRRSDNSNLVAEILEHMMDVRLQVKEFMINHSETSKQQYQGHMSKLQTALDKAKGRIKNPERAAKIAKIDQETVTYKTAFEQLIVDINESDRIINDTLRALGPSMQSALNEVIATATTDRELEIVAKASTANQHMLLARLYAQRFLATVAEKDAELVRNENRQMQEVLGQLLTIAGSDKKKPVQKVIADAQTYIEAFNKMAKATISRNAVYNGTLSQIGSNISQLVADIHTTYVKDQQELGTSLKDTSKAAIRTTLIISSLALFLGIGFAVLITRAITSPVRKTAAFAESMANGDFTTQLDVNQGDEIGVMAHALNQMVGQLGNMIKDIVSGINSLSMSSSDLAAVSRQLSSAAKDTADKSL